MNGTRKAGWRGVGDAGLTVVIGFLIGVAIWIGIVTFGGCAFNQFSWQVVSTDVDVRGTLHEVLTLGPTATTQPSSSVSDQLTSPLLQLGPSTEVGAKAPATQPKEGE